MGIHTIKAGIAISGILKGLANFIFSGALITLLFFILGVCPEAQAFHPLKSKEIETKFTLESGEVYDSNVTFKKNDPKQDFITELSGGADVIYEGKKHFLDLGGRIKQQIFAKDSEFNNNAQSGNLEYRYEITEKNRIRLKDSASHSEEPRSFEDAFGRETGRYSHTRNTGQLEYTHDFGKRLSLTGRYGNDLDLISRADLRDSFVNRAGLTADYSLSSATKVSALYDFSIRHFEASGALAAQNATIHEVAAGLRRYLTRQLFIDSKGGLSLIKDFNGETSAAPLASASLNSDIDEKTRVKFLGVDWRSSTSSYESSIFQNVQISGGIARQLKERLRGSINAFYGHGTYDATDITDNLFGANVNFAYDLTDNLILSVDYSFLAVNSNDSTREYVKNLAGTKLAFVF